MDVQVSIPKTSVVNSYTVYHIIMKLPLKKYELIKRYSDFEKLIDNMEKELSHKKKKFPLLLPPKTKFYQSNNDEMLIENRRVEFEHILISIINNDINDVDWRSTKTFGNFLEIPEGLFTEKYNHMNEKNIENYNISLKDKYNEPIIDIKEWLEVVNLCRKLLSAANSRQREHLNDQISRKNMIIVKSIIKPLNDGLNFHKKNKKALGEGEIRRRTDLLNSIKQLYANCEELIEKNNISKYSNNQNSNSTSNPTMPGAFIGNATESLFGAKSNRRVLGGPIEETSETRGFNDNDLLQQQKFKIQNQDKELEQLSSIIRNQKQIGLRINEELDYQNELLEEIDREVDITSTKLRYANKKTKKITQ